MKKHLKGKSSIEGLDDNKEVDKKTGKETEDSKIIGLQEDLKKDNQLQQAVSLLSGWEVMKKMFKNLNFQAPDSDSRISMK